jgi:chemotaxis protein MotB
VQDGDKREIIIIRRRPDDHEDGHHGGVWKIAYADFMTAMMAFFLVMWLVSATDSHAKKAIAHYFNPIKLVEATDDRKGIRDPQNASNAVEPTSDVDADPNASPSETVGPLSSNAKGPAARSAGPTDKALQTAEGRLFQDPYAVLSDLAKNASKEALHPDFAPDAADKTRSGRNGMTGGNEFRDPFDPVYWKAARARVAADTDTGGSAAQRIDKMATPDAGVLSWPPEADPNGPAEAEAKTIAAATPPAEPPSEVVSAPPAPPAAPEAASDRPAAARGEAETKAEAAHEADRPSSKGPAAAGKPAAARDQKIARAPAEVAAEPADAAAATVSEPTADAAHLRHAEARVQTLTRQIGEALGRPGADKPRLEVVSQKDGVLISLMDSAKGAMFAIGSAEPKPDLVVEMARIGAILAKQKGQIVIGGHTDARPFHNAAYDNWRLSSARAQMAYYMLLRGGLPEKRVVRVEGYADHQPKVPNDPMADANRRIDILIRHEVAP